MALIRLLAPWLAGICAGSAFIFASRQTFSITASVLVSTAVVIGAVMSVVRGSRVEYTNLILSPFIFFIGAWGFWFFLSPPVLLIYFGILVAFFITIYILTCWYYYWRPLRYQPSAIDNTVTYASLAAVFFLSVSAAGLHNLLLQPLWMLSGVLSLFIALEAYIVFWVNNIWDKLGLLYSIAGAVLIGEIFVAMSMLPISIYIRGFVTAWSFYLLTGLIRSRVLYGLNKKIVMRYVFVSFAAFVLAFVSSRWR